MTSSRSCSSAHSFGAAFDLRLLSGCEQIVPAPSRAFADDAVDDVVERLFFARRKRTFAGVGRTRDPQARLRSIVRPLHRDDHRTTDILRVAVGCRTEERETDDAKREVDHLLVDVERQNRPRFASASARRAVARAIVTREAVEASR